MKDLYTRIPKLRAFPINGNLLFVCIGVLISFNNLFSQNLLTQDHWWQPNGTIRAMVTDSINNRVYLGGDFDYIGPNTPFGVQLDTTGTINLDFANPNGAVNISVPDGNGGWYIGGLFTIVGDSIRNHIAHLTADGEVSAWNPNINNVVYAISILDSTVYVGGGFTTVGGQPRNIVAAINVSTGLATSWNPNINGVVYAISILDSTVYVGGGFTTVGGLTRNKIAAINSTSGLATSWNPNASSTVYSLVLSGSTVYAGGDFTTIGGQVRNRIAALDDNTGLATSWNPNASNRVLSLLVSGNTVYAGGRFSTIGGQTRNCLAALDANTGLAKSWNPNANSYVRTLFLSGSVVYVGGDFTTIGGQNRASIAALDTSSSLATSWNPGSNNMVFSLSASGSKVYVGGYFASIGGQARMNIAALDASTGQAISWNPGADGTVSSLAVSGSYVYVGGKFITIGGQSRNKIAALDANTGLATSWDPDANYEVNTLSVSGNTIYVGGNFTTIGGQSRGNLAAIDANTGLATTWNPDPNSMVNTLSVSGNTIYVGGWFTTIGGQTRNRIAAIDVGTGLATSWNPNSNKNIETLHVTDSIVYVGGGFSTIGGQSRYRLAAIDANTGLANLWNPNINLYANVNTILAFDSSVYVGGWFSNIGGQTRHNLAALDSITGLATTWNPNAPDTGNVLCVLGSTIFAAGSGFYRNSLLVYNPYCMKPDIITSCNNNYTWRNGITYTSSNNTATDTLFKVVGCDSVFTLNLTFLTNQSTDSISACDSLTWIDGITYTASNNTATDTLVNALGCDSVVTLNLTILSATHFTDTIIACDSFTWINGITYTSTNNTAIDTLLNAAGCDSLVTLNLSITHVDSSVVLNTDTLMALQNGASYQWLDCSSNTPILGETTQMYVPSISGNYSVEITLNGCVDTSVCTMVNLCNAQAAYSFTDNGLGNYSFTTSSTGNYTQAHWSFGDGTTSDSVNVNHTYIANGAYVVVLAIHDSNAVGTCVGYFMDTIVVTGVNNSVACQAGFSVYYDSLMGGVGIVNSATGLNLSYLWDFGDGNSSTQQFPSHSYATNGPFNLCLTINDGAGCVDTYCDSIGAQGVLFRIAGFDLNVVSAIPLGINEITQNNQINIYPNPVHDQFTMEITNWQASQLDITVLDINGKTINTQEIKNPSINQTLQFNTSKWSRGVYFIQVSDGDKISSTKLILQ